MSHFKEYFISKKYLLLFFAAFFIAIGWVFILNIFFNFTYIEGILVVSSRLLLLLLIFSISLFLGKLEIIKEIKLEFLVLDNEAVLHGFPSFFRRFHIVFLIIATFCYLMIPFFEGNSFFQYLCLYVGFFFISLFFLQFFTHLFFYVKKSKNDHKNIRSFSTVVGAKKVIVVCAECAKIGAGILLAGELGYKMLAGGPNAVSPPRSYILNQMFPSDRTKVWSESKAALSIHNRAMGRDHLEIYKLPDFVQEFKNSSKK